jgi:hydrogenase expression/formation protein HypE
MHPSAERPPGDETLDNPLPVGKLPAEHLARLLARHTRPDPRLVVGARPGEDAAVIDLGDRYLVAKTDPITFATDEIGWYAVNVNANDIACAGATPLWFLATLLLPEDKTGVALVESIFEQIAGACDQLGVTLAGGHTEITHGLDRPIVVGHMLGEVTPERLVTTAGARVGDDIIVTKGVAVEATAIIAREKAEELRGVLDAGALQRCQGFLHDPGISVVRDAQVAQAAGTVHAMHDPTEGGLATGLWEVAQAAGVGLRVNEAAIPLLPETAALCAHFGLDPLGIIASGALLIACPPTETDAIVAALSEAGIRATVLGQVVEPERGCKLISSHAERPLPTFGRDEIARLFE